MQAEGAHLSQALVGGNPSISDLNAALRLAAGDLLCSRSPEHAKSKFLGRSCGEIEEFTVSLDRDRRENLRAMDQSAGEGRAALCGGLQLPRELIFEVGDFAELEHFDCAVVRDTRIYVADPEEGHGNILCHGEGWQQAGLFKEKAEGSIAAPSKVFIFEIAHALTIQAERSRIGAFQQTEDAEQKCFPGTIRTIERAHSSGIERGGDVLDRCSTRLVPIRAVTAESLAGKNRIHF
jgi:hypothetical protein